MPRVEGHPTQDTPYFILASHKDQEESKKKGKEVHDECDTVVAEMEKRVKVAMQAFVKATGEKFVHGDPNPRMLFSLTDSLNFADI
jgi:hypothetical protein